MTNKTTARERDEDHAEADYDVIDDDSHIRDAEILGDLSSPEAQAVLASPVVFGTAQGAPYVGGGQWVRSETTWANAVEMLSDHPVRPHKGGDAYTFTEGELTGRLENGFGKTGKYMWKVTGKVRRVFAVQIDVDGGTSVAAIVAAIRTSGLFAMLYTTHSHSTKGGPDNARVRVVFPLEQPFDLTGDWGERHAEWQAHYVGFCEAIIPGDWDARGRLATQQMYMPARPEGAEYEHYVIAGRALRLGDMPKGDVSKYRRSAPSGAVRGAVDGEPAYFSDGFDVFAWWMDHGEIFDLQLFCEVAGWPVFGDAGGGFDLLCPNAAAHTTGGDEAWGVSGDGEKRALIYCHHGHCDHLRTWSFVAAMEEAATLPDDYETFSALICDGMFYPDDVDGEDVDVLRDDYIPVAEVARKLGPLQFQTKDGAAEAVAVHLNENSTQREIHIFLHRCPLSDRVAKAGLVDALAAEDVLGKQDARAVIKEVEDAAANAARQHKRKARAQMRENVGAIPFIPLSEATEKTVGAAAAASAWLPDSFDYKDGWFVALDWEKPQKDGSPRMARVCRAFEVALAGFGEGPDGRTNTVTIRYPHESKRMGIVESSFRMGDTRGESGKFLGRLRDEGLEIVGQTAQAMTLFQHVRADREGQLFTRSGWHGDTYVSPAGVIVNAAEHSVLMDTGVSRETRGTLEEHHAYATTVLMSRVGMWFLPGYLLSAVGCLADFIGHDLSPIIWNQGNSTRGKTSALRAGVSWLTVPNSSGLVFTSDNTNFAAESMAVLGHGAGVVFDEDGSSNQSPEQVQQMTMKMAGGEGRGRGGADQKLQRAKKWTTCVGRSGERDYLEQLIASDVDPKSGMVARVFSVDYTTVPELSAVKDADIIAAIDALASKDSATNYGVAGPVFASKLVRLGRDKVRARVAEAEGAWSALARGPAKRLVSVAALIRVAGEMAQEAGIFASEVPVAEYVGQLLEDVIEARERHLNVETQSADRFRRKAMQALQEGQIVSVHDADGETFKKRRLGYFGHFAANGAPDKGALQRHKAAQNGVDDDARVEAEFQELADRVYVFPIDRLGSMGVTTSPKSWAESLPPGALIPRIKGGKEVWCHDRIPTEGAGKCIRLSGAFVHGVGQFAPDEGREGVVGETLTDAA